MDRAFCRARAIFARQRGDNVMPSVADAASGNNRYRPERMDRLIATQPAAHAAHSYWTMSRGDSDQAFRNAVRHSRMVRMLRIAIPIAVAIGLVLIALAFWLNPMRMLSTLPLELGNVVVSGTKITMEQPRLSGFTRDGRAYDLTATAAAQDLKHPELMELRDIRAKIEMQDKSALEISALTGLYDTKNEMLTLRQDVFFSSSAYQAWLSEAVVDIRKGNVVSENPVEVHMLNGKLNANRLDVVDSGDLLRFDGGVKMIMTLGGAIPSASGVPAQ